MPVPIPDIEFKLPINVTARFVLPKTASIDVTLEGTKQTYFVLTMNQVSAFTLALCKTFEIEFGINQNVDLGFEL